MNTGRKDTGQTNRDPKVSDDNTSVPDEGTLHNTDPQEHMEGPVSSLMHNTGEQFDTEETKQKADREKEKGM